MNNFLFSTTTVFSLCHFRLPIYLCDIPYLFTCFFSVSVHSGKKKKSASSAYKHSGILYFLSLDCSSASSVSSFAFISCITPSICTLNGPGTVTKRCLTPIFFKWANIFLSSSSHLLYYLESKLLLPSACYLPHQRFTELFRKPSCPLYSNPVLGLWRQQ